jgi:hypothetical protein
MRKYLVSYFWMIGTRNPRIFASIPIAFVLSVVVIPALDLFGLTEPLLFISIEILILSYLFIIVHAICTLGPSKDASRIPLEPSEFGRPVSTRVLVGTPLLVGSASSAIVAFFFTKLVLNRIGYDPSICALTIAAASLFAILHAMFWSSAMSVAVVLAAIVLFAPISGRSMIWPVVDFVRLTRTITPMLIAIWFGSSVVVFVSARKHRRGDGDRRQSQSLRRSFWSNLSQNERLATTRPRSIPPRFRSSFSADLWLIRKQTNPLCFSIFTVYLITYIIELFITNNHVRAISFIMSINVLIYFFFRGFTIQNLKHSSICFYFTRPIESAKKAFLYLYVSAESLFVSCLVLSTAIFCDPTSLVTGNDGYLLKIALKVVAIPPGRDAGVVVACAIFLATILFWNFLFDTAFIGLTGSIKYYLCYIAIKFPIILITFLLLSRNWVQFRGLMILLVILASGVIAKTIVAIGAVYRSRSLGLISRRTMFIIPLVWAAISAAIVALVAASGSFVGDWRSRAVTILAAALTAPLSRFALFPIVLDRVRHR